MGFSGEGHVVSEEAPLIRTTLSFDMTSLPSSAES